MSPGHIVTGSCHETPLTANYEEMYQFNSVKAKFCLSKLSSVRSTITNFPQFTEMELINRNVKALQGQCLKPS